MISILYEAIEILLQKMLNVVYLYWFHSDTLAKTNALISYSNESWING